MPILTANVALQGYQTHSIQKQHCNVYVIFLKRFPPDREKQTDTDKNSFCLYITKRYFFCTLHTSHFCSVILLDEQSDTPISTR